MLRMPGSRRAPWSRWWAAPVLSSLYFRLACCLRNSFLSNMGNTLFLDSIRRISWLNFHRRLLQTEFYMLTTLMRLRFS